VARVVFAVLLNPAPYIGKPVRLVGPGKVLAANMSANQNRPDTNEVEEITGKRPLSIGEWVKQRVDYFK